MKITKLIYNVAKCDYEEVCFVIPDDKAKEIEREKLYLLIEEILKRNEKKMRGRIMNRLTKRDLIRNPSIIGVGNYYLMQELYVDEREKVQVAIEKLAKLEDIGEELGVDLEVLFKALKQGFYVKTKDINEGLISWVKAKDIRSIDIVMRNIGFVSTKVVLFEDYGKTWALTKEELEED